MTSLLTSCHIPHVCWHYKSVYFIVTCHRQGSTKLSTTYANESTHAFWPMVNILSILCELSSVQPQFQAKCLPMWSLHASSQLSSPVGGQNKVDLLPTVLRRIESSHLLTWLSAGRNLESQRIRPTLTCVPHLTPLAARLCGFFWPGVASRRS